MARKKKDETVEAVPSAAPPPGENGTQGPRRPVAAFKCASGKDTYVEVAVWENEVHYQNGETGTQHVASFSRSYKNGEGWKTNHSYRVSAPDDPGTPAPAGVRVDHRPPGDL